jgi:hypothetical protein
MSPTIELALLVALDHAESGGASGSIFLDDGMSRNSLPAGQAESPSCLLQMKAADRQLKVTKADSACSLSAASSPPVITDITILGVTIGITELLLTQLGPAPKMAVIPRSDYSWDGSTEILHVKNLRQNATADFDLTWTT